MTRVAIFFAVGFALSLVLTPTCRWLARRSGFVAAPKEDRWHKTPTALFGGIAIAVTTLTVGLVSGPDVRLWQLIACGAVIAVAGLLDDLVSFKASTKLLVQVIVAAVLVFLGLRLEWTDSLVGDSMLTLFWIVGITNAFNLLDNMDGLCAGIALIAGGFLLLGLWQGGPDRPAVLYLAVLLGATAGFFVYNIHPASIFMGDTGSLFLGLNLAALTLIAQEGGAGTSGVWSVIGAPVLLLLIPIFDTTLVTVLRLLAGRSPSQGGRDHSSHRLVAMGLPEPTAVAVLWGLALCSGGLALTLQRSTLGWPWIFAAIFFLAMVIFAVTLARIRVYESSADVGDGRGVTPLIVNFMYKRRVAEILLDICLISVAYYSAYHLRFADPITLSLNYQKFLQSLPVVLAAQLVALFVVGGYRGAWQTFGMMDAVAFAKGVGLGTTGSMIFLVFAYHFEDYSRGVFLIYAMLLLLFLSGSRASFRLVSEFATRRSAQGKRCVIYGAAGSSLALVREAFGATPVKIIGFIDNDPRQANGRIGGYPVLGGEDRLRALIEGHLVDCVIVSAGMAHAQPDDQVRALCRAHDVELLAVHLGLVPLLTSDR